jgi:hypothetical protein
VCTITGRRDTISPNAASKRGSQRSLLRVTTTASNRSPSLRNTILRETVLGCESRVVEASIEPAKAELGVRFLP